MIFLDTTYIIGLIVKNDAYTSNSLFLEPLIENEEKMINNTVFNEVLNSLTYNNHKYGLDYIKELLLSFNVDFLNDDDYLCSLELFNYYNYSINFSDCTILKTMRDYKITKIASFDSDFDKIKGINRIY